MKVLCINSSPAMEKGNTAMIMLPFLEGMRETGAVVEVLYTKKLKIQPCEAEYICWSKTPGKCFIQDDMQWVLPKLKEADIWVFAAPLFSASVPGPMVNLFDRMLPLTESRLVMDKGHSRIGWRSDVAQGRIVLIATCSYYELDTLTPMVHQMGHISKNCRREFAGALLRQQSAALRSFREQGKLEEVFSAARQAGKEVMQKGGIDPATSNRLSIDLLTLEEYLHLFNS